MLQYDEADLADFGGYDLVHHDDLSYVASAHQECKGVSKLYTKLSLYDDCQGQSANVLILILLS